MLGKRELPEKPTSYEVAPKATRTAQAQATSWPAGRPAQAQLPLRLRARTKESKEKGPPKGTETRN